MSTEETPKKPVDNIIHDTVPKKPTAEQELIEKLARMRVNIKRYSGGVIRYNRIGLETATKIFAFFKKNGYVKLAKEQTTPLVPDDYVNSVYVYLASQADMFQAGWRKVILEDKNAQ